MTAPASPQGRPDDGIAPLGRTWRAGLALAVVAAAAPAVGQVYGPGWLVPVGGAVLVAVVVDLVVRLLVGRGHPAVLVTVHSLGLLLWTSISVRPALDGTTAFGGAPDGVARILTAVPPVDPRGPELAVAVLAAWVVAALTAAVLARARPSLLGVVPTMALFAGGLVLGDPRQVLADGSPFVLIAVCGLVLVAAARADAPRRPAEGPGLAASGAVAARVLRPATALAVSLVAALAGVALAPAVPGVADRDRLDLRARIDPPVEVLLAENPLDLVPPRREEASSDVRFRADVRMPAGSDGRLYWRLSVLDEVGPNGWKQPTSGYVRAGRSLGPPPAGLSASRARAQVDMTLAPATGGLPLIPTIDRPLTVDPAGLAFEPRTAQLAVPTDRARPERVRMDVSVPTYTSAVLTGAEAPYVKPSTKLPISVTSLAQASVARTPNDFQRLSSLLDLVAQNRFLRLEVTKPGNTSDATVAELLTPPVPEPVDGPGTDTSTTTTTEPRGGESGDPAVKSANAGQLAAAFALLARSQGFDVRLAVGYLTPVKGDTATARTADIRVTDEQLTVWPEVRFKGLGWVPFRVSAPKGTGQDEGGVAPKNSEGTSAVDDAVTTQIEKLQPKPNQDPPTDTPNPPEVAGEEGSSRLPAVAIAAVLVLLALCAWGPVGRWWRRRRRSQGGAEARLLGAWDEVVDRLAEGGLRVGADHTRPDVAALTGREVADERVAGLWWLAARTDRIDFAGGGTVLSTAGAVEVYQGAADQDAADRDIADGQDVSGRAGAREADDADADARRGWHVVDAVAVSLRLQRTRRQRVVALLRPPRRLRPTQGTARAWTSPLRRRRAAPAPSPAPS